MADLRRDIKHGRELFKITKRFAEERNIPIEELMEETIAENDFELSYDGDSEESGEEFFDDAGMKAQFDLDERQNQQDFRSIADMDQVSFSSIASAHSEEFANLFVERNQNISSVIMKPPSRPRKKRVPLVDMEELFIGKFSIDSVHQFSLFIDAIRVDDVQQKLINSFDLKDLAYSDSKNLLALYRFVDRVAY